MMSIFHAIVLGVVEGLTEFLPISSTGHLIIASKILGLPQTDFLKLFEVVIQLGALLAIVPFFFRTWIRNPAFIYKKLLLAFLPTVLVGLFAYKYIKILFGSPLVVIASLFIGGVALIVIERIARLRNDSENIKTKDAFWLGLFQTIAFIPGVSRSGATIAGGLMMGLSRIALVEFSFLLALPTMVAASGLDLIKSHIAWTGDEILLITIGFLTAFVSAYIAMKWFLKYISNHTFTVFGIYRIIAAVVFFCILFW